jgi:hypothetical protein
MLLSDMEFKFKFKYKLLIYMCPFHVSILAQSDVVLSREGENEGIFILQGMF